MYIIFSKISKLTAHTKPISIKAATVCRASTIKVSAKCDSLLAQKPIISLAQGARFLSTNVEITDWDKIYNRLNDIISKKYPALDKRMNKLHVSYNTQYIMYKIASKIHCQEKKAKGDIPKIVSEELRTCGGALADQNERAKIIEDLSQGIQEMLVLDNPNDKKLSKYSSK